MRTKKDEKFKLESVEELLGVVNEESAMDIEISKIQSFRAHPFKVLDDDKMQELIDSISVNGILTPVLVRPLGMDTYEMISGHRRMHAAKIVGLTKIPTIIREMTDDEAVINMVDANVQREELLPSEKAFAYRMKLDAMKRQAGRPGKNNVSQNETNLRSDEILAKEIGTSRNQIQRYIRLTELIPELLDMVDRKKLQFTVAVDISYIDPVVQQWLYEYIREFHYFYGEEADMHSFYRIPKLLFTNDYFKALSNDAKILYGLMLDRMSLSMKNQWFDEENKAYIYFSVEDIMELLNCGKNKAVKTMQELDRETGIGLIEKKRQGLGKANMIYVKNFVLNNKVKSQSDKKFIKQTKGDKDGNMEVYKSNFSRFEKQTSRIPQDKLQEVRISNSNNNKFNDTYRNNIKSVHIPSEEGECQNRVGRYEGIDDYAATKELIKEHIEYDVLMQDYPSNQELVQGIFELILETVLYTGNKVIIASNEYPAEIVKNRFMKINYMHIQYVMECLRKNTTQVKNIKKYLLAALFNAPVTMQGYYQAEVNHAMPQFANNK